MAKVRTGRSGIQTLAESAQPAGAVACSHVWEGTFLLTALLLFVTLLLYFLTLSVDYCLMYLFSCVSSSGCYVFRLYRKLLFLRVYFTDHDGRTPDPLVFVYPRPLSYNILHPQTLELLR